MNSLVVILATLALSPFVRLVHGTPHVVNVFKGDLLIKDLFVSNPFQADSTSSYNSTISVIVLDEDYPELKPVHCQIEWKAGVAPPPSTEYQCENATMRAWFPANTFRGVKTFQLQFAHSVIDESVGECPYCILTKFAAVNLTYPATPNYDCDIKNATCEQKVNTTMKAPVYLAIA